LLRKDFSNKRSHNSYPGKGFKWHGDTGFYDFLFEQLCLGTMQRPIAERSGKITGTQGDEG